MCRRTHLTHGNQMRYGRGRCHGGFRGCHSRRHGGAFMNPVYVAPREVAKEPAVQTTGVVEDSPPVDESSMSSENPPAYREIATKITDNTHMAFIHQLNEKPIHAAELGKDSGFIMCSRCRNETYTITQSVPRNGAIFHPIAGLCYVTGIFAVAPKMYLSKYGDKIHYCGVCHYDIARWRAQDGTTVVNEIAFKAPGF